jgi:GNAT superfamily N-acetyltransferase
VIRPAVLSEVPELVQMGCRFLAASQYGAALGENPPQIAALMTRLITQEDGTVLVLDRGTLIGMLGLVVFVHPWAGSRVTSELFWWVEPEVRGDGVKLLKAGERWAREQGSAQLHLVAPTARVAEFYTRLGYRALETEFIKDLREESLCPAC